MAASAGTVEMTKYSALEKGGESGGTLGVEERPKMHHKASSRRVPPDVEWFSMNFKAGSKSILTDCWGNVRSGEVCAIMGPSGAGKSSLLNVLAGRSAPAPGIFIDGTVKVGGKVINPVEYRKRIAYVMQDDALMATATPREALTFSATMRLPAATTREEIDELVQLHLAELGIDVCADVMIGGALIKGISGGQRKRTSVGVELITDPALMFLDEPTSGLDSYTAFQLIKLLKEIATTQNSTMLCTIHQPSSEVFFLFDVVIFMREGMIFYQGTPDEIVPHFSKFGYICPENYNPSDFIMSLSQTIDSAVIEEKGMYMAPPAQLVADRDTKSSLKTQEVEFKTESGFFKQLSMLSYRELISTKRDTAALIGRFGVTFVLNLLFGLIFLGAGGQDNADSAELNTHFGALAMVLISSMFGSAQPVMLAFPFERPMFLREYTGGTYGVTAYFLSKLSIEMVLNFLQSMVQYLLVYFLVDLQGNFFFIALASWGLSMASCSVAVMLGCALTDVKAVTELAPLLYVPQMLFVGFFVAVSEIPVFLRWAQYLCSLKYAMNIVLLSEFHPSLDSCSGAARKNCENLLDNNDIREEDLPVYIVLLFVVFAGFRLAAAVLLHQRAKRFY